MWLLLKEALMLTRTLCCSALVLASAASIAGALAAEPTCDQASTWVRENAQSLPDTLDGLKQLPAAYQQAAYDSLTPQTKSQMWRRHLSSALSLPLNETQREVVNDAIAAVAPDLFRVGSHVPLSLRKAIERGFSEREQSMIFEPNLIPACGCNDNSDCTGGKVCNEENCNIVPQGCGPFGLDECMNGVRLP